MASIDITQKMEYTALNPFLRAEDIKDICRQAMTIGVNGICVLPTYAAYAHDMLHISRCRLICAISYPFGSAVTRAKLVEISNAVKDGANELELVLNPSAIMDKDDYFLANEIYAAAKQSKLPLRLVLESSRLSLEQLDYCARLAWDNGADMLTFNSGIYEPVSVDIIAAMRASCKKSMKIKAYGGIKTAAQCEALWQAGADIVGLDDPGAVINEFNMRG